jgi:2-dehydro-3-deoxyphosphooctonate aldolase (KDO 8-P synthase)
MHTFEVGSVKIGPSQPLTIIAGPCVAESLDLCLTIGSAVQKRCDELGLNYIFKASFDKANRSSMGSYRGPGLEEGAKLIDSVRRKLGVPATTDVHEAHQAAPLADAVDLLQVPAFLCRQTDLLIACAQTGKPVNAKKGQFLSPMEMKNVVTKLEEGGSLASTGLGGIMLTERGTFFGYHRLVNDFTGLMDMASYGWPVCFDVTHSTQRPGEGATSGGRPECAPLLAKCAVAAGVQALFIETHPDPSKGKSDAATMLPLNVTLDLLGKLAKLHATVRSLD